MHCDPVPNNNQNEDSFGMWAEKLQLRWIWASACTFLIVWKQFEGGSLISSAQVEAGKQKWDSLNLTVVLFCTAIGGETQIWNTFAD